MLDRIPLGAKAAMIKFWFAGVAYLIVCWAFSLFAGDSFSLLIVLALVNGLVTAIATNGILRLLDTPDEPVAAWILFPDTRYASFCANILYGALLTVISYGAFALLNRWVALTADPLLFGLVFTLADLAFLGCRRALKRGRG